MEGTEVHDKQCGFQPLGSANDALVHPWRKVFIKHRFGSLTRRQGRGMEMTTAHKLGPAPDGHTTSSGDTQHGKPTQADKMTLSWVCLPLAAGLNILWSFLNPRRWETVQRRKKKKKILWLLGRLSFIFF